MQLEIKRPAVYELFLSQAHTPKPRRNHKEVTPDVGPDGPGFTGGKGDNRPTTERKAFRRDEETRLAVFSQYLNA